MDAGPRYTPWMDVLTVQCPYCFESNEIDLDPETEGSFVQDCEVCCNPWEVTVYWDGQEQSVDVRRGDGSE